MTTGPNRTLEIGWLTPKEHSRIRIKADLDLDLEKILLRACFGVSLCTKREQGFALNEY